MATNLTTAIGLMVITVGAAVMVEAMVEAMVGVVAMAGVDIMDGEAGTATTEQPLAKAGGFVNGLKSG